MAEPDTVIPFSSSSLSSSDHYTDSVGGSSSLQKPSSSITGNHPISRKINLGRPVGSKNRPKPLLVTDEASKNVVVKPIFIEVPDSYDVIKTIVQFARRHQVSIEVLNASGTICSATIRNSHYRASSFTVHGTFKLISLTGVYMNNAAFNGSSSLSSTLHTDPCCSFRISFSGIKEQSFIGVVGGKVVAQNGVMVAAVIWPNFRA